MRSASKEGPEGNDPPYPTALGYVEERLRIRLPPLVRLWAAKQEEAVTSISGIPLEELAPRPVDLAASVGQQLDLGPLQGEHEELFRDDPRDSRGRKVADQVTQGARGRAPGIDPSSKRNDHRRQGGARLAVEVYVVHAHPFGTVNWRICRA